MRTLAEVATSSEVGLSESAIAPNRDRYGANRLTPLPREPIWRKFLAKFDEPIIKILLGAALLSIVVDLFKADAQLGGAALVVAIATLAIGFSVAALREWVPSLLFGLALVLVFMGALVGHPSYEGLAVMIAVALATGVAFASEFKSDREFEVLNARKGEIHVKVTRDGRFQTIPLEDVVVGDLVTLEMGDEVPADGRLVRATDLYIDTSLMTGESEPERKRASEGDDGQVFRGTQVVDGVGALVVTEVGDATMLGQIARNLSGETSTDNTQRIQQKLTISKDATPLQEKLTHLAELISRVGYVASGAIFLALMVRGVFAGEFTHGFFDAAKYVLDAFVYMVIVIVVAVPEGLPMSVTVSLALAMRKMTRANSLVRQLVACETIGSATVICSDKTGTLTQNKMRVERVGTSHRGDPQFLPSSGEMGNGGRMLWLVRNAAVNSTANLETKGDRLVPVGNSTEGALLQWLREAGIDYQTLRLQHPPVYQVHFSSERKRMTTVVEFDGKLIALVKGAPEWLLDHSSHYLDGNDVKPWTSDAKAAVKACLADRAAAAMRTLAFGHAELPAGTPAEEEALHELRDTIERGLVFDGFVAIRDPVRDDVPAAVAKCQSAGIEVKMITGDNAVTARAIATEIGLLDLPDAAVLTSDEFNAKTDEELKALLPRLRVLARAKPLDKLRMVKLLQEQHHVVAMTGDGTNDAASLKRADVGLAMGIAGTEVAKEASKIVLLDDSFATIERAVEWGRALYENIQRFIQFQLTINVSALVIAFLGPFLGVKPPFTVLQLLWINVIMDTFASIALCSEPPRPGLMAVRPKRRDENIVTRPMAVTILSTAVFFVIAMVALLLGMEYAGWFRGDAAPSRSFPELTYRQVAIFFTTYVLFQVWNQINCRSLVVQVSGLTGLAKNPAFLLIASLTVVGQVLIVTFGGEVFQVTRLPLADWLVMAAATASVLLFAEAVRRIRAGSRRFAEASVPADASAERR
ncbi:MAG: calcium-translocating P-type ATPase, PMCA-type [Gemmataceae bacterium]